VRCKADPKILQSVKTQWSAKAPAFAKMQKQGFCTPYPFNRCSKKKVINRFGFIYPIKRVS
jgi:hypothetical protein